jgi:hypothetical protein
VPLLLPPFLPLLPLLLCPRGAPRKYLDSLLATSRLELFRPGVDLLAAGDAVNELFIIVAGRVELRLVVWWCLTCATQGHVRRTQQRMLCGL